MRRIIPMLVLVLTLVACSDPASDAATTSTTGPASLETFEAPELGFVVDYPSDWVPVLKLDESILEVIAPVALNGFVPNFNVTTGEIPNEIPRTVYYEGEVARLRDTLPGVEILEVIDLSVDGVPARGITLTSAENDLTIGISRLLVLDDDGQAWEVSFFAHAATLEQLAPTVTEIFRSFHFTD